MTIDKNDNSLASESKLNSLRNTLLTEINNFNSFMNENTRGSDQVYTPSTVTEESIISFFGGLKRLFKAQQERALEQDRQIGITHLTISFCKL